jgi:RNA polymerase sigma-70 factor (ECF subfamily)
MAERPNEPVDLVAAMAAGDSGPPLNAFYAQYASTVLALLMKMLGSRAEAEEILQDVFVELWRRAPQYDSSRGSVVAWVITVARSRALDALRARTRRHGNDQMQFFSQKHGLGTESGRPDVRAVLELSYFLGMSHGQIAEALNLPVGTVKSRILAGMRALRTMLPIIQRSMVA